MEKPKRIRRTNIEIDKDIMDAMKELVETVGFPSITLTSLAQNAKVEPQVIYNRFGDLNGLFDKFAQKYDYWFTDIINYNIDDFNESNHKEFMNQFLLGMAKTLYGNKSMQQILTWEILESNPTTIRAAEMRETNTKEFMEFYQNLFKNSDIDFGTTLAILIGGVYYLILRKERSTFCSIDFNSKEGKAQLLNAVNNMCSWIFSHLQPNKEAIEIAKNFKKKGIDNSIISECTGLTIEEVSKL